MPQPNNPVQEHLPSGAAPASSQSPSGDPRKASYNQNKLRKRLRRLTGQAIADYNMIEAGDRVMVCLSGGKDSYTMLDILLHLQRSAPIDFEIIAVNLDQKQPVSPSTFCPSISRQWACRTIFWSVIRTVWFAPLSLRGKPLAGSAADCAAARCTGLQNRLVLTKLRWDTIATTLWRRSFSTCSLVGS